jgi:hypothetical protein
VYGLNAESNVFFVQGYNDDKYEVTFGNGVIGRAIANGNIIKISYISTDGEDANKLSIFKPTVAVEGFTVSSIVADDKTYGGAERESVESIKFHAPRHFTTQERAVVEKDFENLVRENFPIVQSVLAYGGERLNPPQYGRVAIFIKPYGIEGIISDNMKRKIANFLEGKSITTKPVIINPEYFYIRVKSNINYDPESLNIPLEQLKADVISSMRAFSEDFIVDFDSDLRYSKFVKAVDATHDSIVSNDTSVSIIKRWSPVTGSVQNFKFAYGTALRKFDVTNELEVGVEPTFTSSVFSYVLNGISYSARLEDNGIGIIKVIANNSAKTVLNNNVGQINYETGAVEFNVNVSTYSGYISLYALARDKDIKVSENRFLILDTADISVTMVSE